MCIRDRKTGVHVSGIFTPKVASNDSPLGSSRDEAKDDMPPQPVPNVPTRKT